MQRKERKGPYVATPGEERANAVSHGAMAALALAALPFSAVWTCMHASGGAGAAIPVSVFVMSVFLMLLVSTLYHSMPRGSRQKEVFHMLDHIFIYVAIAGSYTPVALLVIGGWQGALIAAVQWIMALFGVFYKTLCRRSAPGVSLAIYLVMGWTIVFFLLLFVRRATPALL